MPANSQATSNEYELESRELVAQSDGLRVQVLTLGPGHCVPWHKHTNITDSFFCLDGPMVIETRGPDTSVELEAGDRASVPAGQPHFVSPKEGGRCKFAIVQGVGEYDFVPVREQ
ncbi:MAG: cupin domain-containing protein [Gammaproteobacteria bacterium]